MPLTNIHAQSFPVAINEVMFAPVKPEPEWIELLNTTSDSVHLAGWLLTVHGHASVPIPDSSAWLAPDSMVILSANDTALAQIRNIPLDRIIRIAVPALNNSGSAISLRDTMGTLMDSMNYDGNWIKADGISIERSDANRSGLDPGNWEACQDPSGATILRPNSIRQRDHDLAI
ncbi:MAG TPA: lamin tail domain-containing protein [Candidatus Kapabacteria bacterium]|jgi:hypothetical protein